MRFAPFHYIIPVLSGVVFSLSEVSKVTMSEESPCNISGDLWLKVLEYPNENSLHQKGLFFSHELGSV